MAAPVSEILPMQAPQKNNPPFTSEDWVYQMKFDGYRCLAGVKGGRAELRSRMNNDCTRWYPEIAAAVSSLKGEHVIDGEACVLDEIGRSDFEAIHKRSMRRRYTTGDPPAVLAAFDIMVYKGEDIRQLVLVERRELLRKVLAKAPGILFVQDVPAQKELFAQMVLAYQLEGFVAKRKASTYQSGVRSGDWLKVKRAGATPAQRFDRAKKKPPEGG